MKNIHNSNWFLKRSGNLHTATAMIMTVFLAFVPAFTAFSLTPENQSDEVRDASVSSQFFCNDYVTQHVSLIQQAMFYIVPASNVASLNREKSRGYSDITFAEREKTEVHPDIEVIQQWQIHRPVSEAKLQDSAYQICKNLGITSLQSYVGWAQLEPEKNKITYDFYDPVVNQLRKHNLKWLPFLITGPYIATPEWFREEHGVDAICLEHNIPIRIQSIWNPELLSGVRRFLELFQEHYDPSVIEALNLGISGNWGESIYPAGGGFDMKGVHTHIGWWCGDKYAQADFQRWLKNKYLNVVALNIAWKSDYDTFEEVKPFLPENAPSPRASVDLGNWYTESMTDYAEYWVKTARELFPSLPIYLCTGGDGQAALGADFSAQARMCAKYDAGIRITNMNDNMLKGFSVTRMVSSSTRLYGGYYTSEPAGQNSPKGIAGRIFDIVAGGGRGAYFKSLYAVPEGATQSGLVFTDFAKYLKPNTPKLNVAALMPNSSIILNKQSADQFLKRSAKLRDILNFEFIDENMISDGLLDNFKAVVMLSGTTLEASTLDKLKEWVETGGVLFTSTDSYPLKSVDGLAVKWMQEPNSVHINPSEVIPVDTLATQITFDEKTIYSAVSQKRGNGYTVSWPDGWNSYKYLLNSALLTGNAPWQQLAEPLDGAFDNVLACRVGKKLVYYLNNGDSPVEKKITPKKSISIAPRTLVEVKIR